MATGTGPRMERITHWGCVGTLLELPLLTAHSTPTPPKTSRLAAEKPKGFICTWAGLKAQERRCEHRAGAPSQGSSES